MILVAITGLRWDIAHILTWLGWQQTAKRHVELAEELQPQLQQPLQQQLLPLQHQLVISVANFLCHIVFKESFLFTGCTDCENTYSSDSACSYWASLGYCTQTYVAWMSANCEQACGTCGKNFLKVLVKLIDFKLIIFFFRMQLRKHLFKWQQLWLLGFFGILHPNICCMDECQLWKSLWNLLNWIWRHIFAKL